MDAFIRRRVALLSCLCAGLAGLSGCAGPLDEFRHLNAGAIRSDQVLLIGKVHIQWPAEAMMTSTWLRAGYKAIEYPLPESEQVAWLTPRPSGALRVWGIDTREGRLRLPPDMQPVLMTSKATGPIVYFGTVFLNVTEGRWTMSLDINMDMMRLRVINEAAETLREFIELNPTLAGRPYFDILRGVTATAPLAAPAPR